MSGKTSVLGWLRKGLLLYLLIMVALSAWLTRARTTDWNDPLHVVAFPINKDGSAASADYIEGLSADAFEDITDFLRREGERYGLALERPLRFTVTAPLERVPPAPPAGRNTLGVMAWSLKLRHYAWREQRRQGVRFPDVRLFVLYHDPAQHPQLAHSLGLKEGLIGVVNAYASRRETSRNNVVIAHEILHTLGATDKYDPATNLPRHPEGYAEPDRRPLLPQSRAEIMGGRIPIGRGEAVMPDRLRQAVIGPATAREIRWVEAP